MAKDTSAVHAATHAAGDTGKAAAAISAPANTTAAAVNDTHTPRDMQGERRTTTAAAAAFMVPAPAADLTFIKSEAKSRGRKKSKFE